MYIRGSSSSLCGRCAVSEIFKRWKTPDEATLRARHRRACLSQVLLACLALACFCLFISTLLGVPQSLLGELWMKPPRYPGAVQVKYAEGEVCLMPAPGVYCYEWFYRTNDPLEEVVAYYEGLEWRFHPKIKFEWTRGRRFGLNWVAGDCVRLLSNLSCYQIIVHPSPDNDTEVYILEHGGMGEIY
jgi:hypothetical protein